MPGMLIYVCRPEQTKMEVPCARHKPGFRPEIKSSIKDHAEFSGNNISMNNVSILEKNVGNLNKRTFLESLYSQY